MLAGQVDAYYQYMLKPWDTAAGIVILEEAGGRVTTADGSAFSVFDRSMLCTNDALYEQVSTEPSAHVAEISSVSCTALTHRRGVLQRTSCSHHGDMILFVPRPGKQTVCFAAAMSGGN